MSAQTSNLPIQTPQQSRTVYSNNIIPISSYSQRPGMMATTNLGAPKKVTPKYYEEYGLCVPLIKHGQKRPHARAACELASKSKAGLLEIVKDLAPSKVAKLKSASKSDILQWIERVETLALGPHPKTQLPSTKKEDLIESLGFKNAASKAKGTKLKNDTPRRRPGLKKASSPTKDKVIDQSIVSFSPKTDESEQKVAPVQQATPPASSPEEHLSPKPVTTQKQISHDTPAGTAEVAQKANKRKYDSAEAPTNAVQTPAKKTRVIRTRSPEAPKSPQMSVTVVSEAQVVESTPSAPIVTVEQASQDRITPPATSCPTAQTVENHAHEDQEEIGLGQKKKRDPSTAVHLENENIVITHVPYEFYKYNVDYNTGSKTRDLETFDGGRSYTTQTNRAVCFTYIPHGYDGDACPPRPAQEPPFLKPGVHGRGGDFDHDPDRETGRGHQIDPADLRRKREYEAGYRAFYKEYPFFPFADRQRKDHASEHVEGLKELRKAESWMRGYREKYVGENVGCLWDCGCEMVREGEESEEE